MCRFTFFTCDCEDSPPRPVRTSQCLLAKQGRECQHDDTHVPLTSTTCVQCLRRTESERKAEAVKAKVEEIGLVCEHMGAYPRLSAEECFLCGQRVEVEEQIEATRRGMSEMGDEQGGISPASKSGSDASSTFSPGSNTSLAHTPSSQSSDAEGIRNKPLPVLEWELPTRCFIDAGFIRMDPWAADREKQAVRAAIQRHCQSQGFQYTVPYPYPEDREDIDPLSRDPRTSTAGFQQRAYATRASTARAPIYPPGLCVPVGFQIALAPCCAEKTRLWREKHLRNNEPDEDRARDTITDDCCTGSF